MYKKLTIGFVFVLILVFTPIGGYSVHFLVGDSMEPTIQDGSIAIVDHSYDLDNIEESDIVVFEYKDRQYAHRYLGVGYEGRFTEYTHTFKGDNRSNTHSIRASHNYHFNVVGKYIYYTEI